MTKINLGMNSFRISFFMGYHGQKLWISQQQMKSTKIQNPNLVMNLLQEMEKIWTNYFYNEFFNFS